MKNRLARQLTFKVAACILGGGADLRRLSILVRTGGACRTDIPPRMAYGRARGSHLRVPHPVAPLRAPEAHQPDCDACESTFKRSIPTMELHEIAQRNRPGDVYDEPTGGPPQRDQTNALEAIQVVHQIAFGVGTFGRSQDATGFRSTCGYPRFP